MTMQYALRIVSLIIAGILAAACSTTPTEEPTLPTRAVVPSPTATLTPTPTHTLTPTPRRTPEPTVILPESIADNPADQVYLRVIHTAPDLETVDVYVERLSIATNLTFGMATGQAGIAVGDYTVRVVPTGNRFNESPLLETTLQLEGGQTRMLLLTGTPDALTLTSIPESTDPLRSGQARATFIHAVPGGPEVTVLQDDNALVPSLTFSNTARHVQLASGRADLTFQAGQTVISSQLYQLRSRYNRTFVVVGRPDNPDSLAVIDFESQAPALSSLRVLNVSEVDQPLDIYLNDTLFSEGLGFGQSSGREDVPTAIYTLYAYPPGADPETTTPLLSAQYRANPEDIQTLIITGPPENLRLVTHHDTLSPTPPDAARIVFVHADQDSPVVRLQESGERIEEVSDLQYGQASEDVLLAGGREYDFYWGEPGGATPLELGDNVRLEAGRNYLYLFTGRVTEPPIVISENVGIDQSLVEAGEATLTPTPRIPTRIRVVNAFRHDDPVSLSMDELRVIPETAYTESSGFVIIPAGLHTLNAELVGNETFRDEIVFEFETGTDYTLFIYGSVQLTLDLMIVSDQNLRFDIDSPHMRLVHLSQRGDEQLGLGYSTARSDIIQPGPNDNFRLPITRGVTQLVEGIGPLEMSAPVRPEPGTFNIRILDTAREAVALTLTEVLLEAGQHYDVVAYREPTSIKIEAFIVPYPEQG